MGTCRREERWEFGRVNPKQGANTKDAQSTVTHVSRLIRIVQQSSSSAWSMNWKTPEVRVDHWMAKDARSILKAMLPNP